MAQTPARVNAAARANKTGWDPDDAPPFSDPDAPFLYEREFSAFIETRAQFADANAFLAIARAGILHNVGWLRGGFERALANMKAQVLMIPCEQDMYFPPDDSRDVVNAVNAGGGRAELYAVNSNWGHFMCLFDTELFAPRLHDFIEM